MKDKEMNVVIVDDDIELSSSISEVLSDARLEVSTFETGGQAIDWIKNHEIDAVICDINMPSISGYEVMEFARGKGCDLVIAMSGNGLEWESKSRGATEFIRKPIDFRKLIKILKAP